MEILSVIFAFLFGSIIGSFLNVVILRMNTGKNLGGRSHCMSCDAQLKWYELVPIFSYLFLQGKCKTCKTKISKQYVIVEFLTGILFAGILAKFFPLFIQGFLGMFFARIILWMILVSVSVVISVYDIKHQMIDVRALGILAIACVILGLLDFSSAGILVHVIGALIVPLPFLLLWISSKGNLIGFGDIEIMSATGFLFGAIGGFSSVTIGFWLGTIVALGAIAVHFSRGKKSFENRIAFAPFLLAGIYLVGILNWNIFARILGIM